MKYLVKIYIGTHFSKEDSGTNVSVKIMADSEEQSVERALNLLKLDGINGFVYETWKIK